MTVDDLPSLWLDLVAHNDGARARTLLLGVPKGSDDLNRLLIHALERKPLPVDVLGAFEDTQRLTLDWLRQAARHPIDWTNVLQWRHDKAGAQVLEREMSANFEAIAKDYAARKSIFPAGQFTSHEDLLLAMLDRTPRLATTHYHNRIGVDRTLFELATLPQATDWLARSGLDVLDVIRDGTGVLGNARAFSGGMRAVQAWVALHPSYEQAWNTLVKEDLALMDMQTQWFDQWLPRCQWKDSPLEAWCHQVSQGVRTGQEGDGPLDHPAMKPPLPLTNTGRVDGQAIVQIYTNEFNSSNPGSVYYTAISANNRLRDLLLGENANTLWVARYCPVEPLGKALYFQDPWGLDMMATQEGARQIQELASRDRRVEIVLGDNSQRQLCQWLIDQPSWRTWRASDGRTLLDLGVDRKVKRSGSRGIPKALLIKLAKAAPDILLHTNANGVPALERIDVLPSTKAAVRRHMLAALTPTPKKRKRQNPRAL